MDITNKIALSGGAAVAVVLFGLLLANARLKTELAEAQKESIAYRMANDTFASEVARQNKAVEQLKADGAARAERAEAAASDAQDKARRFFVAAEKIRNAKTRGDACKAADNLFNLYLKDAP